jgi:hypothetical protein
MLFFNISQLHLLNHMHDDDEEVLVFITNNFKIYFLTKLILLFDVMFVRTMSIFLYKQNDKFFLFERRNNIIIYKVEIMI